MCSFFFLVPVIVRNNPEKLVKGTSDIIIMVEDAFFLASFLNLLCSKDPLPIPGITISCQTFMFFAIILSWMGMRQIAGFIWLAVIALGCMRLSSLEIAWGLTGAVYITFAFVSLILQGWKIYNLGSLNDLRTEFLGSAAKQVAGDIKASADFVSKDKSAASAEQNLPAECPKDEICEL